MIGRRERVGARLEAGDDAAHHRAVTVGVEELGGRIARLRREIDDRGDLVATETGHVGNTRVDDGDGDASTRDALRPEVAGADLVDDVVHGARRQGGGVDAFLHRRRVGNEGGAGFGSLESDADGGRGQRRDHDRSPHAVPSTGVRVWCRRSARARSCSIVPLGVRGLRCSWILHLSMSVNDILTMS